MTKSKSNLVEARSLFYFRIFLVDLILLFCSNETVHFPFWDDCWDDGECQQIRREIILVSDVWGMFENNIQTFRDLMRFKFSNTSENKRINSYHTSVDSIGLYIDRWDDNSQKYIYSETILLRNASFWDCLIKDHWTLKMSVYISGKKSKNFPKNLKV